MPKEADPEIRNAVSWVHLIALLETGREEVDWNKINRLKDKLNGTPPHILIQKFINAFISC